MSHNHPPTTHLLGLGVTPQEMLDSLYLQGLFFQYLPSWGPQKESVFAIAPLAELHCETQFSWSQLRPFFAEHVPSLLGDQTQKWGPLAGGVFGAISYEASLQTEPLRGIQNRTLGYSTAYFGYFPTVLSWSPSTQEWSISGDLQAHPDHARQIEEIWRGSQTPKANRAETTRSVDLKTSISAEVYGQWVKKAQEHILKGDIYQANLAHPICVKGQEYPSRLFGRIHAANPSPWAALLRTKRFTLLSNSPELLVSCHLGKVQAKPIAGTRPRGETLESDQRHRENLLRSPKERAEHLMLVDLVRNDLGRICAPGTVQVPLLMDREPYQNVTHIVSTIEGQLDPAHTALDTLIASFPGGTITGTPKLRSMEIIDSLEAHPRGYYTGSLGYLSAQGDLEFNILIRTLQLQERAHDWTGHLHVGAGIVADSNPVREYQETLHKAAAWSRILSGE